MQVGIETSTEEKWILESRLTTPWLGNFGQAGNKTIARIQHAPCTVDLNEVTFIDKGGERLLRMMTREGARLTATGIYAKHVIEKLNAKPKHQG